MVGILFLEYLPGNLKGNESSATSEILCYDTLLNGVRKFPCDVQTYAKANFPRVSQEVRLVPMQRGWSVSKVILNLRSFVQRRCLMRYLASS